MQRSKKVKARKLSKKSPPRGRKAVLPRKRATTKRPARQVRPREIAIVPGVALVLSNVKRIERIGAPPYPGQFSENGVQPPPPDYPDLGFVLVPGVNEILATAWEHAKWNETVAEKVASGDYRELGSRLPADRALASLRAPLAKEIVGQTFNRPLLSKWLREDARDDVRREIQNRIDFVIDLAKPKKSEGASAPIAGEDLDAEPAF